MGPQNGDPLCPCQMVAVRELQESLTKTGLTFDSVAASIAQRDAFNRRLDDEETKKRIMDVVSDAMLDLLVYDRRECEHLGRGKIEDAIIDGVISIKDILGKVEDEIRESVDERIEERSREAKDAA